MSTKLVDRICARCHKVFQRKESDAFCDKCRELWWKFVENHSGELEDLDEDVRDAQVGFLFDQFTKHGPFIFR